MRVVRDFPRGIREIENIWIPMPDGVRLAARLWLPEGSEDKPVPAILEYIPYRKRDFMRLRDEPIHRYFAGHGYAAVRVDLRGTGDSDGVLEDEYSRQELDDAEAVIAWLAAQPWCDGCIGMMGISWGGFNALQVAARRPQALKAVISLCAADDRYADDAHYMGGCLLNENLQWGAIFWHLNAYPPDPLIAGDGWREKWRRRLDHSTFFPALWLGHQRRDDYWRHGSVCEDYGAIACPVYAIGGWADGYSNAVPRLLAGLSVPRKGLIGPWAHTFPHAGMPGPAIGFLQEAIRWWDHWLSGKDSGLMDEPSYRAWMQESVPPQPTYENRPGRWIAEESWPSPRIRELHWWLNEGGLGAEPRQGEAIAHRSPQSAGLGAGNWCGFGGEGEAPLDQRVDDGKSLVFDSLPLDKSIEILGAPTLDLTVSVDQPTALLAVRLNDVAPDGASTRVTYGLLNLTRREGHDRTVSAIPGEMMSVSVRLNDIAHVFPAGHRIRVAISTAYWPIAWPSPKPTTLTVMPGRSSLSIPVRPARPEDGALRLFDKPERGPRGDQTTLLSHAFRRTYERDVASGETVYTIFSDGGELDGASLARLEAIDLEVGYSLWQQYRIRDDDPLSASVEIRQDTLLRRVPWATRIRSQVRMWSTVEAFRLQSRIEALDGANVVAVREWDETIPRDGL